jgi:hypothetical protein
MYTLAVDELVMPVKKALGTNVSISSVPGSNGIELPVVVIIVALEVALVDVLPSPKNTTTLPLLITRY